MIDPIASAIAFAGVLETRGHLDFWQVLKRALDREYGLSKCFKQIAFYTFKY
jgi:hypothetical protein